MKAGYDIERAKLDASKGDTVSRLDIEQAKLAVVDAQQRERELKEKVKSDDTSAVADLSAKQHKREKALFDLRRAEQGLKNLELRAPAAGMVNVLPNLRELCGFRKGVAALLRGAGFQPAKANGRLETCPTRKTAQPLHECARDPGRIRVSR